MYRVLAYLLVMTTFACSSDDTEKTPENNVNSVNSVNSVNNSNATNNTAPPETCDGIARNTGEACDGDDLAGETCLTLGFSGGSLACRADCLGFETEGCERDQSGSLDMPCPDGQHVCDAICVMDETGPGCGPNCELCPQDPNAETLCASGVCGMQCEQGFQRCSGTCSSCPGDFNFACAGPACQASACPEGSYDLMGTCTAWIASAAVGSNTNHPSSPSIVIGDDGVVHVAYFNGWSGGIRYATFDGATWTDTAIGVQDSGTPSPSIALDSNGYPHIGGALIDEQGLSAGFGHFWFDGATWQSELIMAGKRAFGELHIDDTT